MPEGIERFNAIGLTLEPVDEFKVNIPNSPAFGDPLFGNEHLGVDLLYLPPDESFPLHTHPGHHIIYVVRGGGTVTIDGVTYHTIPGDVYMVEAELPHAVGAGPFGHYILSFGASHIPIDSPERMHVITEDEESSCNGSSDEDEKQELDEAERFRCTSVNPWTPDKGELSSHPDAIPIADADDIAFSAGNKTTYRCPNCNLTFKVTEPDY